MKKNWFYITFLTLALLSFVVSVQGQPRLLRWFDEGAFVSRLQDINCVGTSIDCTENLSTNKIDITITAEIGGSGTTNTIPLWTSSSTLGDSIITESGTTITVAGNVVADTDATRNLGTSSVGWLTVFVSNVIEHANDSETGITFTPDKIAFSADGIQLLALIEDVQDEVVINDTSLDVDFRVETDLQASAFVIDGGAETATFNVPLTTTNLSLTDATNQILLDSDGTFTGQITLASLTASRTYTFPDATGTVMIATSTLNNVVKFGVNSTGVDSSITDTGSLITFGDDTDFGSTSADTISFVGVIDSDVNFEQANTRAITRLAAAAETAAAELQITGGTGGVAGVGAGGLGGTLTFTAGTGGAGDSDSAAGAGGSFTISGGTAGADGGGGGASGGALTLTGGNATGAGTDGDINLGSTTTNEINFGAGGVIRWTLENTGDILPLADNAYNIGNVDFAPARVFVVSAIAHGASDANTEIVFGNDQILLAPDGLTFLFLEESPTQDQIVLNPNQTSDVDFIVRTTGATEAFKIDDGLETATFNIPLTATNLSLTDATNQILLDSDGTFTGQITMDTLTASRTYTFPDVTGGITVLGQTISQSETSDLTTASSPTFAALSLNDATNQILLDADGTFTGQITMATLTASRTYTFPDATGTVAVSAGTANTLAKFDATSNIVDSNITDNGTTIDIGGTDLDLTGSTLTITNQVDSDITFIAGSGAKAITRALAAAETNAEVLTFAGGTGGIAGVGPGGSGSIVDIAGGRGGAGDADSLPGLGGGVRIAGGLGGVDGGFGGRDGGFVTIRGGDATGSATDGVINLGSTTTDLINFGAGGSDRWQLENDGDFVPLANNVYDIGSATVAPNTLFIATEIRHVNDTDTGIVFGSDELDFFAGTRNLIFMTTTGQDRVIFNINQTSDVDFIVNTDGTANALIIDSGLETATFNVPLTITNLSLTDATNQILLDSDGTFTGQITMAALTASRTYTLPDESGTICTLTSGCGAGSAGFTTSGGETTMNTVTDDLLLFTLVNPGNLSFYADNPNFTVVAGASGNVYLWDSSLTEAGSGTHADMAGTRFAALDLTDGAGATTLASTVKIDGAPVGSASPTRSYALFIDSGNLRLDGLLLGSGTEGLSVDANGSVFIGDTANLFATRGLTIRQGAFDDEIAAYKSTDIAHGVTAILETDTYAALQKFDATTGGLQIRGVRESTASHGGIALIGTAGSGDTAKSTSALANVLISATEILTTSETTLDANANIVAFRNNTGTRWLVDAEGDTWQLGSILTDAATNMIVFDNDQANTGTISMASLTAARTWTFPDATGTVMIATSTLNTVVKFGANSTGVDSGITDDATTITLGNDMDFGLSSADTISLVGVIDSNINVSADNTLDIGSTTVGIRTVHVSTEIEHTGDADTKILFFTDGMQFNAGGAVNAQFYIEESATDFVAINQNQALDNDFIVRTTGAAEAFKIDDGLETATFNIPLITTNLSLNDATNQILLDADGTFTGQITMASLTASRTWTFPDATGTVALSGTGVGNAVTTEDLDATDVTVANTVVETTIYSFSVPANTLSTANQLRLRLIGRASDATGGGDQTMTVRLKYGATTLATATIDIDTTSTDDSYNFVAFLAGNGATNSQVGSLVLKRSQEVSGALTPRLAQGSSAEDSTTTLTLTVTFEWDVADATLTYTMEHAALELLS